MKKLLIVFLSIALFFVTACSDKFADGNSVSQTDNKDVQAVEELDQSQEDEQDSSEQVVLKPNYEDALNKDFFTGFSEKQLETLKEKGFVVLKSKGGASYMYSTYEGAEYNGVPVFITTDAVLNMYHIFYSQSMKVLEEKYIYKDLGEITLTLLEKSLSDYESAPEEMTPYYEKLSAYYYLSAKLLFDGLEQIDYDIDSGGTQFYTSEECVNAINKNLSEYDRLKAKIPQGVSDIASVEYNKMLDGENVKYFDSEIFGYDIDYSQFKPRGHYNSTDILKSYFRAMMNYSLAGFELSTDKENIQSFQDGYVMSMLLTKSMTENKDVYEKINNIYKLTSFYSGKSDDLDVSYTQNFIDKIYGDKSAEVQSLEGISLLLDESYYDKVIEEINKLPTPKLVPKIRSAKNAALNVSTARQLRFMGQRYNFDSFVMQELTEPDLRTNISAFDVLATFGNRKAKEVLDDYYKPAENWSEYYSKLAKLQKLYREQKSKVFTTDLYHAWLSNIELALNNKPKGNVPYFMTTDSYKYKNLNTALGSYAELKHDNVLYSKQMVAEMGGPEEGSLPLSYLEPNTELYKSMCDILTMTSEGLSANNITDEDIVQSVEQMKETMQVFVAISEKELSGEDVSNDELKEMVYFGALVDYMNERLKYNRLFVDYSYADSEDGCALISDVATIVGSGYLELGIGYHLDIYVLTEVNGNTVIAEGSVYSAVEFFSDTRLTDEEWRAYNGLVKNPEYGHNEYNGEKDEFDMIDLMPYAKEFVSDEDNTLEYRFDKEVKWPSDN